MQIKIEAHLPNKMQQCILDISSLFETSSLYYIATIKRAGGFYLKLIRCFQSKF